MASWDIATGFIGTVTVDAAFKVASRIAVDTAVTVVFSTDLGPFSLVPATTGALTLDSASDGTLTLVPA